AFLLLAMGDHSVLMLQASRSGAGVGGAVLRNLLAESAYLPSWLLDYVIGAAESLPIVIRSSGVQILIFLAGLQSIPREIYEAVSVEGATPDRKSTRLNSSHVKTSYSVIC